MCKGPYYEILACAAAAAPYLNAFYLKKRILFVPAEADEMAKTQSKLTAKTSVVCEMLGLSQQRHQQLYADGTMPPPIDGKVNIVESVKAYISILKREDPVKQARAATEAAKLRKIEIQMARELGELYEAAAVESHLGIIFGAAETNIRTSLENHLNKKYYLSGKMERLEFLSFRNELRTAIDAGWAKTARALNNMYNELRHREANNRDMSDDEQRAMLTADGGDDD